MCKEMQMWTDVYNKKLQQIVNDCNTVVWIRSSQNMDKKQFADENSLLAK